MQLCQIWVLLSSTLSLTLPFLLVIKQDNLVLPFLTLLVPLAIIMDTAGPDRVFQNLYPANTSKRDPSGNRLKIYLECHCFNGNYIPDCNT